MGFMTEMSFLNDDWDRIRDAIIKDPKGFVDEIQVLMNGRPKYGPPTEKHPRGEYLGSARVDRIHLPGMMYFTVHRSHHADDPRLYLAYQNSFTTISRWDYQKNLEERPDERTLDFLEREIKSAEMILKEAKAFVKEQRAR